MPAWVFELLFYGGVAPALLAGFLFALGLRMSGPTRAAAGRWGAAVALALAFFLGCRLLELTPWKPDKTYDSLPYLAVLAALAESACALFARSQPAAWGVRALTAIVAALFLTPTLPHLQEHIFLWRAAVTFFIFITWSLLEAPRQVALSGRASLKTFEVLETSEVWAPRSALPLGLISLATAIVIELAGFDTLAEMAGVLAAGLFGIALVAWFFASSADGIAGVTAVVLTGLIFNTYFYHDSEVPWLSFLLILLAPSLVGAVALANQGGPASRWRSVLLWFAALAPAAAAVALAALSESPSADWQ